ncbi:hypothetical protein [Shimazuella soli]|uniref:hypothetical protein n=1 Tax=Shimazuella soli TaxID=1892854 RepID=UPI001F0EB9BA|nr:hypothetical protein [Shimazuella soli]
MGFVWECEVRSDGFKLLYGWLENKDALVLKADRKEWLVVLPLQLEDLDSRQRNIILDYQIIISNFQVKRIHLEIQAVYP